MSGRVRTSTILALISASLIVAGCSLYGEVTMPPGFAIVYGVSDYAPLSLGSPDSHDLTYPDDDAEDVAALLSSQGYDVIVRTNEDATMMQLELDFADMADRVADAGGASTRFVFYFAGHGYGDGMESVYGTSFPDAWEDFFASETGASEPFGRGSFTEQLLLHDAMPINSVTVASEADVLTVLSESLSDDELSSMLNQIPSAMKMVIIDACHSGGFRGSGTATDTVPENYVGWEEGISVIDTLNAVTLYLDVETGAADVSEQQAIVITAAGEQEFSYEGPLYGNGIFTHYLLESATEADENFDGFVTTSEAYAYAKSQITRVENDYFFGEGKFVPRVSGGGVDFILFSTP